MSASISQRLTLMIATSAIALVVVGAAGMVGASKLESSLDEVNNHSIPSMNLVNKMEATVDELRINALMLVLANSPTARNDSEHEITNGYRQFDQLIADYKDRLTDDEDKRMLEEDKLAMLAYRGGVSKLLVISQEDDLEKARAQFQYVLRPLSIKLSDALHAHAKYSLERAKNDEERSVSFAHRGRMLSIAAILAGLITITAVGLMTRNSIRRSLTSMQDLITRIESQQDFTIRARIETHDEIGHMTGLLNRLIDKLQGNLKTIAQGARKLSEASASMAISADQVARTSDQQSSSASSMAASIEEMTVSINHVGDRAHEANEQSTRSGTLAESGAEVIGQTVSDINEIADTVNAASERILELEAQSDRISSVVAVIREVADQTNLLALNAAIEAARAGEQGRGFAVVADEVRKLAERTASSTHEISSMVETVRSSARNAVESMAYTVQRVSAGVARAAEASAAIRQIGASSEEAVSMVSEITHAIREQSAASTSIAQQVESIAQAAEESNATASQSAQSARELDSLAASMQRIVSEYKL